MDAGDLPGSPIRGDSMMENERARLRVRINARDRDRENERSTPTRLLSRWANAGAACRRNWLSQRPHYGALRDINGTLLWQHQLASPSASAVRVMIARVCVSLCARMHIPHTAGERKREGERSCRSRSS